MEDLINKVRSEDQEAIAQLYEQCKPKAVEVAKSILKDDYLAEDMFQESFVKAVANIEKFDIEREFQAWFDVIVANTCKSYLRKKKPDNFSDVSEEGNDFAEQIADTSSDTNPEECWDNKEVKQIIGDMIKQLPDNQKEAILLYHYGGLAIAQIADYQNCSVDTVKSRLFQGRNKIKNAVEEYENRSGIKLHTIAVIPVLYLFFKSDMTQAYLSELGCETLVNKIMTGDLKKQLTVETVKQAGKALTGKVLTGKAIAGIVAAVVVGTGVIAGTVIRQQKEPKEVIESVAIAESTITKSTIAENTAVAETVATLIEESTETESVVPERYLPAVENTSDYDAILQQGYEYFSQENFGELVKYDVTDETKALVEYIKSKGMDRYICQIPDTNLNAMLYVHESGGYTWYFGDLENGIRQGNGTAFLAYPDSENPSNNGYRLYRGCYADDLPNGEGVFVNATVDGLSHYDISGMFNGAFLNGTYDLSFINKNYIDKLITTTIVFENGAPVVTYDNFDYLIPDENETYFIYYDDGITFESWPMKKSELENGFLILSGNKNILEN